MDVNALIKDFEEKEHLTVFADFEDNFYAEARDEIIAEMQIRSRYERAKQRTEA